LQRGYRFLKQFRQNISRPRSFRQGIEQIHEPSYEHQRQSRRHISV
jgi:hypothetical protein